MTCATHYSGSFRARAGACLRRGRSGAVWLVILGLAAGANATEVPTNSPVPHLEEVFVSAQAAYQEQPKQSTTAWQFARACFDRAEFATNSAHRAGLANLGIEAARAAVNQDADSAAAHYYLGMNLGQLARTKSLGALRLVDEMEREFKQARVLDDSFDYAGPDRNLGRLYFQAPSIGSVGSRSKARVHFDKAAELAPDYPENGINLVEAAVRWKQLDTARRELALLEQKLTRAKAQFSGIHWMAAWMDWNERLEKVRSALRSAAPPAHTGRGGALFN